MREIGTVIMVCTLVLSVAYLIAERLVVKAPLAMPIQRIYVGAGIVGVISGFSLYFLGG